RGHRSGHLMRTVALSDGVALNLSDKQRGRLKDFLKLEHQKIIDARAAVIRTMQNCLRMYEGNTEQKRWVPFEGAPCVEVTIGAQYADSVYAQALDLIFQVRKPLTIRARKGFDEYADAVQAYVDWGVDTGKF